MERSDSTKVRHILGGTNYNKTSNVFTTGNGIMNYSLPEGDYRIEMRFSSTTILQGPDPGP